MQQLQKNCNPTRLQLVATATAVAVAGLRIKQPDRLRPVATGCCTATQPGRFSDENKPQNSQNGQKMSKLWPKWLFFSSRVLFLIILLDFFADMECTSMEIHYIHHRALFLASPDQLQLQLGCIFCMTSYDQL